MSKRLPLVAAVLALAALPAGAQDQGLWNYSAKFVCGFQPPVRAGEGPVKSGNYATEINIHNYRYQPVAVRKKVLLLVEKEEAHGREPRQVGPRAFDGIELRPDGATMDDCNRIWELIHPGVVPPSPLPLMIGYLVLLAREDVDVDVVYTAAAPGGSPGALSRAISIDVERVPGKRVLVDPTFFPGGLEVPKAEDTP